MLTYGDTFSTFRLLAQCLRQKPTIWLPIDTGIVGDMFSNQGQNEVQQLVELYGSRKKFLKGTREDYGTFVVDEGNNTVTILAEVSNNS